MQRIIQNVKLGRAIRIGREKIKVSGTIFWTDPERGGDVCGREWLLTLFPAPQLHHGMASIKCPTGSEAGFTLISMS
jgi:hypothetical protein